MNRNQLSDAYLHDKRCRTDKVIVVSMRANKQMRSLSKLLDYLNYATNHRVNRYALKKNSKFPRIGFFCNNEDAFNNTHSHLYLLLSPCHDFDKVVSIMKTEWAKLDRIFDKHEERYVPNPYPSFDLYVKDVKSDDAYASYSVKDFNNDDEYTFVPI
ncbi:hypothetical protein OAI40_01360 [Candidatus Pseudothioglobus singularis]|nr:hypothetical protein [Candidatus Pseudothioglobus singularis]MDB4597845.1 hypothetical protein [Candidatus Pseudothioglobus singularis]